MKRTLALLLAAFATPCLAQELRPVEPSVMYYLSIPIGAESRRDADPVLGFSFQGKRAHQSFSFDTRMMNFLGTGVFEAKFLIIGAAAAGVAVAAGSKDKSVAVQQEQQAAAAATIAEVGPQCPVTPSPCFAARRYRY
jgi:hypothetical protein